MATVTERSTPRISINQLAKYLAATPTQRRRIIRDQKRPPTYKVVYYEHAKNSIARFIVGGCSDESVITDEIARLVAETPSNEYEEARLVNNVEALEAFLDTYDALDFDGLTVAHGYNDPPKLILAGGVEVSVRPELVLDGEYRGQPAAGAIKLYFSKGDPLTRMTGPYITAVVNRYADQHLTHDGEVASPRHSCVLDVFAGELHRTPAATTRRFQDLEAASQEIALWWPVV